MIVSCVAMQTRWMQQAPGANIATSTSGRLVLPSGEGVGVGNGPKHICYLARSTSSDARGSLCIRILFKLSMSRWQVSITYTIFCVFALNKQTLSK